MSKPKNIWFHNESLAPGFSILGFYWAIPVSWQGWLALALYVVAVAAAAVFLMPERWLAFLLVFAGLTLSMLLLSLLKGKRIEGHGQ